MGSIDTTSELYEVLIIGGGPAGLSAAGTLARQLHTCLILDSGDYRNAPSKHMHNVVTWDHRDPEDFRAAARKDVLQNYETIRYEQADIGSARRVDDDGENPHGYFEVGETGGRGRTWRGRKLLLATGVRNEFPAIEGYEESWGTGIFHCLFCDGLEHRGKAGSAGVLAVQSCAMGALAMRLARNIAQLRPVCNIYTDGNAALADEIRAEIKGYGPASEKAFKVDARKIVKLSRTGNDSEVVVTLDGGDQVTEAFLTHNPKTDASSALTKQLGLEMGDNKDIVVTSRWQTTSVKGVFTAGDCNGPYKISPNAMSSGSIVAAGISAQLQSEQWGHKPAI